jgi:FkbM family methyltransferase
VSASATLCQDGLRGGTAGVLFDDMSQRRSAVTDGWTYDYDGDLRALSDVIEPHRRAGFTFANIGANDGVNSDPIWPFATSEGWRGVCVEPVPLVCELLRANYAPYPEVQIVQAAIADEPRTFWYVDGADFVTNQIGSLDRGRVESSLTWLPIWPDIEPHVPAGQPPAVPIDTDRRTGTMVSAEITCLTFTELADQCGLDRVDLVNIDTEGADYEVLTMIDLDRYRTSVVIVETVGTPDEAAIRSHLVDHGFELRRNFGMFSTVWDRDPFA